MKISIQEEPGLEDVEVVIRCGRADGQVRKLAAALGAMDQKLTGLREGQTYLLEFGEVLYADTADGRTFLYTAGEVYETALRLYELEERTGLMRASKSALVNFDAIRSLRPDLGGRLRLTMENGEAVYVSRQYAPDFKARLGL